jgi:hypothetical protein
MFTCWVGYNSMFTCWVEFWGVTSYEYSSIVWDTTQCLHVV